MELLEPAATPAIQIIIASPINSDSLAHLFPHFRDKEKFLCEVRRVVQADELFSRQF